MDPSQWGQERQKAGPQHAWQIWPPEKANEALWRKSESDWRGNQFKQRDEENDSDKRTNSPLLAETPRMLVPLCDRRRYSDNNQQLGRMGIFNEWSELHNFPKDWVWRLWATHASKIHPQWLHPWIDFIFWHKKCSSWWRYEQRKKIPESEPRPWRDNYFITPRKGTHLIFYILLFALPIPYFIKFLKIISKFFKDWSRFVQDGCLFNSRLLESNVFILADNIPHFLIFPSPEHKLAEPAAFLDLLFPHQRSNELVYFFMEPFLG